MIIVALGLLFTGAFAGIILYKRKIKNRSREVHNPVNVPPTSLDDDDYVDANDIISFDNDIQQRKRQRLKVKFRDLHSRLNGKPDMVKRDTDIKEQVNILPYNKSRELPRNSLEFYEGRKTIIVSNSSIQILPNSIYQGSFELKQASSDICSPLKMVLFFKSVQLVGRTT